MSSGWLLVLLALLVCRVKMSGFRGAAVQWARGAKVQWYEVTDVVGRSGWEMRKLMLIADAASLARCRRGVAVCARTFVGQGWRIARANT